MNHATTAVGAIGGAQRPATELDIVTNALEQAQSVASRVSMLADRLCGSQPETARNGKISETPDGILPRMAMQAHHTRDRLADAQDALERIERALA